MQEINIEERDYYAILGIPRSASADEIKQRFRLLSKQFHPDKQPRELQEYANELFHRIERANQVLGDEKKRKLYDMYGEKAVSIYENNEELVKHDDSLDAVDDLIHTLYQRELEVKSGQSGSFTFTVDATSLLHSQPTHISKVSSMYYQTPQSTHVSSIQIVQGIQTRLTPSDSVSVMGTATSSGSQGYGVGVFTYQHQLSAEQQVTLSTMFGARNRVSMEVAQALTQSLQGAVGLSYSKEGMETEVKVMKQLSDSLSGSVRLALTETVECSVGAEYKKDGTKMEAEAFVGHDLGGSASILHTLNEKEKIRGKISATASLGDMSVDTMIGKDLSPFSKANMNVVVGLKGIQLKFKYQRGGMNFILPIQLSNTWNDLKAVAVAFTIPLLIYITGLTLNKLTGASLTMIDDEEAKHAAFLLEHHRLAALSQQTMMRPIANRISLEETDKKGLVIIRALYGDRSAIGSESRLKDMNGVCDVTVPLQFLVKESRLKLYAGSKKDYMGFYSPSEEKKGLYVRYNYGDKIYEIELDDLEPVYLPAFRATEIGVKDLVC